MSYLGSAYFFGFLGSSLIVMFFADHFGRKIFTYFGLSLQLVVNIILFFVRSPLYLYVYMALIGIRTPLASHVPYMLQIELTSGKYRPIFGLMNSGFNGFSILLIALIFLYISDWKIFMIMETVEVAVLLICYIFVLPDSPRFYISKK